MTWRDVQIKPLKPPLSVETLARGEGDPPELVKLFFSILLGGPDYNHHSPSIRWRADSVSQDALFVVKSGKLKPAKHIVTSLSLKSLTGSRKIITMTNKLGHSLSYNKVEELEIELAYSIIDREQSLPDGVMPGMLDWRSTTMMSKPPPFL